jgi:hypothetical protein
MFHRWRAACRLMPSRLAISVQEYPKARRPMTAVWMAASTSAARVTMEARASMSPRERRPAAGDDHHKMMLHSDRTPAIRTASELGKHECLKSGRSAVRPRPWPPAIRLPGAATTPTL